MNNNQTIEDLVKNSKHLSDAAKLQIENIRFTDEQIAQLRNELAVSNTARSGYLKVLNTP